MSYIARKFDKQVDVVGNGQCVTLVKTFSGAPAASLWREGEKLTRSSVNSLAAGTVIATFVKGRYPNRASGNHAAVSCGPRPMASSSSISGGATSPPSGAYSLVVARE